MSSKRSKLIAVALAVVMVVAAFTIIYPSLLKDSHASQQGSFGPKLIVHTLNPAKTPDNSTTSTTIQVYSVVPKTFGISGYPNLTIPSQSTANNSYYVELLNQTMTNNISMFLLSPEFNTISSEWISTFSASSGSNLPSLVVDAYYTVYSGNNISIYSYYNNLPYNPMKIVMQSSLEYNTTQLSQWFNGTSINPDDYSTVSFAQNAMYLNLTFPSIPSQVLHVSGNSSAAYNSQLITPDQCSNFYYNETCYSTCNDVLSVNYSDSQDMHSPVLLPVLAVHLSNGTYSGKSLIEFYSSIYLLNDKIGLNSANAYESNSGQESSTMSTSPSFEHLENISNTTPISGTSVITKSIAEECGTPANNSQNYTTGIVGITNVTYEFTHYIRFTYEYTKEYERVWSSNCTYFTDHLIKTTLSGRIKDGAGTQAAIVNISSLNGIQIIAEDVPIEVNMIVHDLLESASNGSIILSWTGSSSSYQASTIWSQIYSYSNAASEIKTVSSALGVFSSSLELGLAISDALAATNAAHSDVSLAAIVADATTMIAKAVAMPADIIDLFSTISFVSGSNPGSVVSGFSSYTLGQTGSNYSIAFYESQYPVTFTVNGNSYSFYAPTDYLNATGIIT